MTQVTTERATETPASTDRTTIFVVGGLVLLVFALFARTMGSSFGFYLDDYMLLRPWTWSQLGEAFTAAFDQSGNTDAYFRPLAPLSFALDWELWGTNMWGYHLTNIVLHAGATVAVFALLRRVRVPQWCAVVGAVLFAVIPSNVAAVVYVAERTDVMAAIFTICGLLCVHGYQRSRSTGMLIGLNVFFVVGLLTKEIAVAMLPMAALYWWYLRIEQLPEDATSAPSSVLAHWREEVRRYWAGLTLRERRSDWLRLFGPMTLILGVYLVYRQAVLPGNALGGRFAETQNPLSALSGGVRSTIAGVPWEISSLAIWPLIAGIVLAFVLEPRARAWRVVLLGFGFVVSGVLPLTFSGGVEPRLLYVAEIGVAIMIAGLAAVYGAAFAADRRERRGRRVWLAAAGALVLVFSVATIVSMVRAQNLFKVGSDKMLAGELQVYEHEPWHPFVVPAHWETLVQHLVDGGVIDPP